MHTHVDARGGIIRVLRYFMCFEMLYALDAHHTTTTIITTPPQTQSITLGKLCKLMGAEEGAVEQQLALLKKLSQCITWSRGEPLEGSPQPCSDIEVTISGGPGAGTVIEVRDAKPHRKQTDFLLNHIVKFQQIVADLDRPAARTLPAY